LGIPCLLSQFYEDALGLSPNSKNIDTNNNGMLDATTEDNIPILKQRKKPWYIRKYGKQSSDYLYYSKIKSRYYHMF